MAKNLFQMILRVRPRCNHHYRQGAVHQQLLDRHHLHQNRKSSNHHLRLQQGHHTENVILESHYWIWEILLDYYPGCDLDGIDDVVVVIFAVELFGFGVFSEIIK